MQIETYRYVLKQTDWFVAVLTKFAQIRFAGIY